MSEHKQDAPIAEPNVKRYDVVKDGFGGYFVGLSPVEWGRYVLYDDHVAALSASEQRERVLRDKLKRVRFGVQLMVPEPQKGGFLRIIDEPEPAQEQGKEPQAK